MSDTGGFVFCLNFVIFVGDLDYRILHKFIYKIQCYETGMHLIDIGGHDVVSVPFCTGCASL